MDELTTSFEEVVDQLGHSRPEHISMDSPPPPPQHYMFTNVDESQYVQPHGPKIEVNLFIREISTFSFFFKLHKYAKYFFINIFGEITLEIIYRRVSYHLVWFIIRKKWIIRSWHERS